MPPIPGFSGSHTRRPLSLCERARLRVFCRAQAFHTQLSTSRLARYRLAVVGLAAFALAPAALAQPADGDRLPSLTPQEFVIRGTVQIDLPQIERQPLTGFGPPPRVFVVPADRTTTDLAFAPDPDALPDLGLDAPTEPPLDIPTPRRLRAEAGGGTQAARYGRLDLDLSGAGGQFYVDADYDGLGGGDIDIDRVDDDRLDLRAGGRTFGAARLSLDARVAADSYTLPGAGRFLAQSRRERRHASVSGGLEGVGATPYAVRLGYAANALGPTDDALGEGDSEGRFDASVRVAPGPVRLDATGGVSGDGGAGSSVRYGSGGGALALGRPDGARLTLGARGMTYANDDANSSSTTAGPIVDLALPLGPTATVFAVNDPRLAVRSLFDVSAENAYVGEAPRLAPDVFVADARAGLALALGAARLRFYGLGQYTPTRLAFGLDGDGLFTPSYVSATVFGGGADLALVTSGGVSASAGVEFRESEVDGGGDLPFLAALVGRGSLAVPFAQSRGRVGLSVHAEGARAASIGGTDDADPFALVALDARYDVAGPFAVTLRGERLLGTVERWPGFPGARRGRDAGPAVRALARARYLPPPPTPAPVTVLAALATAIRERLVAGADAPLPGLGTLTRHHVPARLQSRPDGSRVLLPPSETIRFSRDASDPSAVAAALARTRGLEADGAAPALRDAVDQLEAIVVATGEARLPGVGLFRRTSSSVLFAADTALLAEVNRPYAGLQPVEGRTGSAHAGDAAAGRRAAGRYAGRGRGRTRRAFAGGDAVARHAAAGARSRGRIETTRPRVGRPRARSRRHAVTARRERGCAGRRPVRSGAPTRARRSAGDRRSARRRRAATSGNGRRRAVRSRRSGGDPGHDGARPGAPD